MKVALLALVLALGCSKTNEDKAKDVGKKVEAEAKDLGKKIEVEAKKDIKLAQKPLVLGPPVEFAEGMKVLCESVHAETTRDQFNAAISDALHHHPNAEVISFWQSVGDMPSDERLRKLKVMTDRAALATCPLADWLAHPPAAPAK
jgi:hypothetical protein